MPWPWSIAVTCLDIATGQVINWPLPIRDFRENEFILEACWRVWRVVHLHHKPKSTKVGKKMKANWTPVDVDLFAFLTENAGLGWTLHLGNNDG